MGLSDLPEVGARTIDASISGIEIKTSVGIDNGGWGGNRAVLPEYQGNGYDFGHPFVVPDSDPIRAVNNG